ncbi:MAG: hypothetical protein OXP74_02035 [Acidobacteriota bacterium]|nr:hypothetical protein [Acidobacteriota bacterium]
MSRGERKAGAHGANLPLPEELRRSLLDIALGESLDRDGEARTVDLESVRWPRLEPSAPLVQRLLEIPRGRAVLRPAAHWVRRGPAAAVAASYLLAAALTLAVGDPVALGRKASSELRAVAGQHVLEPAARAGSSMQAGFGALQERLRPTDLFEKTLTVPRDRVQVWFRGAFESSADAFRGLTELLPLDAWNAGEEPPETDESLRDPRARNTDLKRTFA